MSHAAGIAQRNPFNLSNALEPQLNATTHHFGTVAVEEQRFDLNVVCFFPRFPVLEATNDDEFESSSPKESGKPLPWWTG